MQTPAAPLLLTSLFMPNKYKAYLKFNLQILLPFSRALISGDSGKWLITNGKYQSTADEVGSSDEVRRAVRGREDWVEAGGRQRKKRSFLNVSH